MRVLVGVGSDRDPRVAAEEQPDHHATAPTQPTAELILSTAVGPNGMPGSETRMLRTITTR